jgi:hypothetical protein
MNKTGLLCQRGLGIVQIAATSGWRTRLRNLSFMDWAAILVFFAGVWIAFYTTSLRHP